MFTHRIINAFFAWVPQRTLLETRTKIFTCMTEEII